MSAGHDFDLGSDPRKTDALSNELAHFRMDMAALSGTWLPDTGFIKEDYTIYCQGRPEGGWREHGVSLASRKELAWFSPDCSIHT